MEVEKIGTIVSPLARSLPSLFITIVLATILVLIFSVIRNLMGGASFNPSTTATLYVAGLKPDASLISMAVLFPVQAPDGALEAMAILRFMPKQYKFMFKGPSLKVDLHTGLVVDWVLTFVLNFALLVVFLRGPKNLLANRSGFFPGLSTT